MDWYLPYLARFQQLWYREFSDITQVFLSTKSRIGPRFVQSFSTLAIYLSNNVFHEMFSTKCIPRNVYYEMCIMQCVLWNVYICILCSDSTHNGCDCLVQQQDLFDHKDLFWLLLFNESRWENTKDPFTNNE